MKDKLKFGLVGTGGIAQAYAQAFKICETAQLVAVADIRAEAARALAEEMKCRSFASYEAMAEGMQLDAVIVCSPPVTHPEICHFFLKQKLHVLCEKPFTIDAESARSMCEAAEASGVKLTMA